MNSGKQSRISLLLHLDALTEMVKDREPAPQPSTEEMESEPPKKKMALLLMESESDDEAHAKLAHIAQRYLATPASTVPCAMRDKHAMQYSTSKKPSYQFVMHFFITPHMNLFYLPPKYRIIIYVMLCMLGVTPGQRVFMWVCECDCD